MTNRPVHVGDVPFGDGGLALIAGPCVIESEELTAEIARRLAGLCGEAGVPFVFKASFDKANRTSIESYRGPGLEEGLEILGRIKAEVGCPVLTDIHLPEQAEPAAAVLDALQIPAFLCRQTDLLVAAGETGKPVNIKKAQFLAPWDLRPAIEKVASTGNRDVLLTERGASFGYNNLVSDPRSIPILAALGCPVVFDATHSTQLPGGQGTASGGRREMAPVLARAAVAAGADALFLEVHPDPERGRSDAATMLPLDELPGLLAVTQRIHAAVTAS
jgi:2-dehydro-3-deoxyphosphooctonate aldolase (KDO 8-P synthase)